MSVVQALLIALFVAAVESRALGYATLTMRFSPLMAGFVVGLVLGNMPLAMTTVATIQLIYHGRCRPRRRYAVRALHRFRDGSFHGYRRQPQA